MIRILLTMLVGAAIGLGLGRLQSSYATSGYEERFTGSRTTLAETRGEKTRMEISSATGTPRLEIDGGTEFNFGTMQHGDSMSHVFIFRNIGDGPLNLEMGSSTCKCTVGELKSSILQPGEQTEVTLTWNAVAITSAYGQTAMIHTNDPLNSEVRLQVKGQIADSFVIEPSALSLGEVSVTDAIERKFYVYTYLEKSKELNHFQWSDAKTRDKVDISVKKVELEGERLAQHPNAFDVHEVTLNIKPGLNIGLLHSRISFTTDQGEKVGRLEIPVTARVTGDIAVVGGPSFDTKKNILEMGTVKSSEGAAVSISLAVQGKDRDNIQFELATVEPSKSLLVTLGDPKLVGNRRYVPLNIEVPKGAPSVHYAGANPNDFGKVVLKTNHEFTQEITIHIRLNVVN